MNRIGIDLGGTKIEGVLLDEQNNVLKRERILTERENGYDAIIGKIVLVAETLIKFADVNGPIGICTPGAIDHATAML